MRARGSGRLAPDQVCVGHTYSEVMSRIPSMFQQEIGKHIYGH
jgi:hypothetical protein